MANLLKNIFYFLRGIFSPKSGLVAATVELQRAVQEARQKNRETGHRFYAIWDAKGRHLVTLTYDAYRKRADSYILLRQRGAFPPTSRREFQDSAFFYTASKNGALEMTPQLLQRKLQILRARYYSGVNFKKTRAN